MASSSAYKNLNSRMQNGKVILIDGGIGTELELRGVPMDSDAWCGVAAHKHLDILEQIHCDYIQAGAEIITANTYASSGLMLENSGFSKHVQEININAIAVAKKARKRMNKEGSAAIAGSLSHMVPILKGKDKVNPAMVPNSERITEALHEQTSIFVAESCDLILLEMMYSPERMEIALEAATQSKLPVWAGLSARRSENNKLVSYDETIEIELARLVESCAKYDVDAIGIMHTQAHLIDDCIKIIKGEWGGLIYCYPDSGYFQMPNWQFKNIITPEELEGFALKWAKSGATAIGGCCGLSPQHISALRGLKK